MPGSPVLLGAQRFDAAGENTGSSEHTFVSAGASANTKGSYQELIGSTPFDVSGFMMHPRRGSMNGDSLLDIAIGGAGSEQVILANMLLYYHSIRFGHSIYVPLTIPKGTRIAFRLQSTHASATIGMVLTLFGGGAIRGSGLQRASTWGANTGDSGGVQVDPGGTAHTKGSYSEITGSTGHHVDWLLVFRGNQANNADTVGAYLFDIAIGAGGSEQVIVPDIPFVTGSGTEQPAPALWSFPCSIPAGSRIAIRAQSSVTDATDRLKDYVVVGLG